MLKCPRATADVRKMPLRALALFCSLFALAVVPASASAAPKKVAFKFSATSYSVVENAGTFDVTVVRSGNTSAAASVQYSDNGTGTATGGGVDYTLTGGTLNFAAGETKKTFPVTIVDNATANAPNKTIVFRLANATPGGSQIKTTTTKLTIIDNEGPGTLDFGSNSYTVLEGAGVASVTVNRIGATNLKLSVDYATQAAPTNPATAGTDYTPINPAKTLTFNVGDVSKTFQVAIPDDSNAEAPENVDLVLSNPKNLTAGAAPQIGPNGPAELTINDDDASTFRFSAPAYSVHEDDAAGHATITVGRTGAINIPASVNYSTSDGTATIAGLGLHKRRRDAQLRGRRDRQDVQRQRLQRCHRRSERDGEPHAHERCDDRRHLAPERRRQRQPEGQRPAVEPGLPRQRGRRQRRRSP